MEEYKEKMTKTPFLFLSLDLPSAPLYKDELEHNIIPQVPLATLLAKFNGLTEKVKNSGYCFYFYFNIFNKSPTGLNFGNLCTDILNFFG